MPLFEYACDECGSRFELLLRRASDPASCPDCSGDAITKQISVFAVGKGGPDTLPCGAPGGTCSDPRGPGACQLDN